MVNAEAGYFVTGSSVSNIGKSAQVVYGKPVLGEFAPHEIVRPLESAFDVFREGHTSGSSFLISRYHPSRMIMGHRENAVQVSATSALNRLIDELVPEWERQVEEYIPQYHAAFEEGVLRAGLDPDKELELEKYDEEHGTRRVLTEYVQVAIAHIRTIPQPPLIRVEGLDEILNSTPITFTRETYEEIQENFIRIRAKHGLSPLRP